MAASKRPRKPKPAEGDQEDHGQRASVDTLNVYIREIAKFKPLTPDDEKALGRRIQEGDQEARSRSSGRQEVWISLPRTAGTRDNPDQLFWESRRGRRLERKI